MKLGVLSFIIKVSRHLGSNLGIYAKKPTKIVGFWVLGQGFASECFQEFPYELYEYSVLEAKLEECQQS